MPDKRKREIKTIDFRGETFDIDLTALRSLKVQTAIVLAERNQVAANEAFDLMCCGKLVEYMGRIPDADGNAPDELGCSAEDWQEFCIAAAEAANAKN